MQLGSDSKMLTSGQSLDQWSSWCAPVYTSVHENYFNVHRKNCKKKNIFLMTLILYFSDILGI